MYRIDALDRRLLRRVQEDSRRSYAALGKAVGLSASAVHERLRKLKAQGVIRRYTAVLEPRALGLDICAFILVLIDRPEHTTNFLRQVKALPAVQECHHVTGDYSYLLKVRTADTASLEALIDERIKAMPGVTRSLTIIALSSAKDSATLDCGDD